MIVVICDVVIAVAVNGAILLWVVVAYILCFVIVVITVVVDAIAVIVIAVIVVADATYICCRQLETCLHFFHPMSCHVICVLWSAFCVCCDWSCCDWYCCDCFFRYSYIIHYRLLEPCLHFFHPMFSWSRRLRQCF